MAHSFDKNDITDIDLLYLKKAQTIEKNLRVCMLCVDIVVTPNPNDPSHPNGKLVAPYLEIIRISPIKENDTEKIEVTWICPICHNTRLIEKFDNFDSLLMYLKNLISKNQVGKSVYAIIDILENKKYENLPGYTIQMVLRNIRDGE